MVRPPTRVVSDVKVAKLLVDPIKRQILRHLAERELTQKMLGEILGMSDPSVSYHLKELKNAQLIRVVRNEAEAHGILQKFYEANALYFIVDYGAMPPDLRGYFLTVNLERLRGVFAILRALKGARISMSSGEMEILADRIAHYLGEVAREYESHHFGGDRESLIINLYGDALQRAIEEDPAGVEPLTSQISVLGLTRSKR